MIGKEKLFSTFENVVKSSKADETEITFVGNETGLTRFANSTIHQNVNETNAQVLIRTVIGKKIGVASTNSIALNDLKATLKNSLEIAKFQRDNKYFDGLPGPAEYAKINTYFENTADYKPKDRARQVKRIFVRGNRRKYTMAGAFSTGEGEVAVFNTKGVRCYQPLTGSSINIIAMSKNSSGYASGTSRDVNNIDPVALADIAVEKARLSKYPKKIKPGDYEVILEPSAIAEAFEWLNYVGFNSRAFMEKRSFLAENIGKKIMHESITIFDDGNDPSGIALPFDFEGVPKKKVYFVDKGVGKGVVWDRLTGKKHGVPSTGHALTADNHGEGAIGLNIFIGTGDKTEEEMISSVERGILVTRFHYVNGLIDPPKAVLTGMTRDGTFLIENGQIKHGIKNLRFTDSMLRAFSTVKGISKERKLVPSWWDAVGCIAAPTIHLGSLKFTGTTDF
ncbi:MAG: TldD/PmbA family protein [candidate division Zixibacteria bacterium HGW-Zixibacteria-1]|nr:MAG: TldD/PmbA family protein [candidate division Zixibacteria bacterium HGW-Zixibacteria-1]